MRRAEAVSRTANTLIGLVLLSSILAPDAVARGGSAAGTSAGSHRCAPPEAFATEHDGTPTILGTASLDGEQLVDYWRSTGRGQPEGLGHPVEDVLAAYIEDGTVEGVRGDWALAQAILETGWFKSRDTAINNFAGIGHRQDRDSGYAYPDARAGVRAHIQLLKRFAAGNDVELALPEAAPPALASASTWGQLAGTWASSPEYWTTLAKVYRRLHRGACG